MEELRAELLRRLERDQRIRTAAAETGRLTLRQGLHALWIDRRNTTWLARVVRRHGWPGIAAVGPEAAHAAWLLAQHADRRPDVQRAFLALLREAVESGDAARKDLAYLEDRVRVNAGRPQLYGTQYGGFGAAYGPQPIEDPDTLDARRAEAGLQPMADYDAEIRRAGRSG
ncbi:hypothetical protein E1293_02495 [Actinomadura darangshiensis]|uniref:Uncharacterized protein n=1 Tax=Actinomadura darangshiensis TaxID=705336 RepID=A0A4V2YXZ2_9ACTN|nr:DUF6624 domain-containing protein [Actinomadura darangshiensis]TDD91057.1 hypothetical protein E1293_02495 [Actinomadura darangshiensis]